AGGEVGPLQPFAAADVEDVGIRGSDGDGPDGAGGLVVEDRRPGAAVVVRLPDPPIAHADLEDSWTVRDARRRFRAAPAMGADHPPAHLAQEAGIVGLGAEGGPEGACGQAQEQEDSGSAHGHQMGPPMGFTLADSRAASWPRARDDDGIGSREEDPVKSYRIA